MQQNLVFHPEFLRILGKINERDQHLGTSWQLGRENVHYLHTIESFAHENYQNQQI